jgi:ribonuclease VapC
LVRAEPGAELVRSYSGEGMGIISAVNYQEVIQKLAYRGFEGEHLDIMLDALKLDVKPHDDVEAKIAASLCTMTAPFGCGLAERCCLALALRKGLPVLTTDQAWVKLQIPDLEVRLAR